jgi:putative thioredoxin
MGSVIDVDQSNFQSEVIARSRQTPVVVDFWAPWCGPCRMLGPVLERLANEPGSNFVLAKLNTDHNQAIAMQYGIRGIPAVKAFRDGRVVDEFVGAQPEPMVRQFLQRVTAAAQSGAAKARTTSQSSASQARPAPSDPQRRLREARRLLREGKGCDAERLLQNFPGNGASGGVAQRLLPLARFLCHPPQTGNGDVDALVQNAAGALRRRDYGAALYNLLAAHNRGAASGKSDTRAVMEAVFTLLGDDDPLARQYRDLVSG